MGNTSNKLNYRDVVEQLRTTQNASKNFKDDFWRQFWPDYQLVDLNELFSMINPADLRTLREEKPQNFAQLVVFCSEQLINCSTTFCNTVSQQNVALNCCRLLIRLLPYVYEDEDFLNLLWSDTGLENEQDEKNREKPKKPASPRDFIRNNSKSNSFKYDKSKDDSEDSDEDDEFGNDEKEGNNEFMNQNENYKKPLAIRLINAISDLLFCPEFTVVPTKLSKGSKSKSSEPDTPPLELNEIDSCEFIWQSGVGFQSNHNSTSSNLINFSFTSSSYNVQHLERNRIDLLRLLLVIFSETMYKQPSQVANQINPYIQHFTSSKNRHCLPLFTSFLNTVLAYQPNSSYFNFYSNQQAIEKEQLIELCLQLLIVCLDHDFVSSNINQQSDKPDSYLQHNRLSKCNSIDSNENMSNDFSSNMIANNITNRDNFGFNADDNTIVSPASSETSNFFKNLDNSNAQQCSSNQQHLSNYSNVLDPTMHENLFINYLARLHREEDFHFVLKGFVQLLNAPLVSTYLPSSRRIQFHQELLILFWKSCDLNKKFLYFTLKSSKILEVLIPILYHLNESRGDHSKLGLIHIGIFIILLLSGERNFGVRLNKPFNNNQITFKQIPIFTGTHADLLIIVFHKLITTGSSKLQSLFECLLTIIVNISPYLKSLSMVSANRLLHFFEAFSTPWFLYCNETNHHLIFYLLEIFNNIIQYQFDGNSNLIYQLLRKRHCFNQLANLPTDYYFICKSLNKPEKKLVKSQSIIELEEMEYAMHNLNDLTDNDGKKLLKRPNSIRHKKASEKVNKSVPGTPVTVQQSLIDTLKENEIMEKQEEIKETVEENDSENKDESKIIDQTNSEQPKDQNKESSDKNQANKSKENKKDTISQHKKWKPTPEWVASWKKKLPLQTIMRMLQVLVPQVEKMSLDKGITDENEILHFLENGTLVGLLPVPHPILIRKFQTNSGTTLWFRTYMYGVIFLNMKPPIWYETEVKLFEIQKL